MQSIMPIHLFGHLQTNLQKLDKSKDFVQKCHEGGCNDCGGREAETGLVQVRIAGSQ